MNTSRGTQGLVAAATCVAALALLPQVAEAQPRRRTQPIVIQGQVPTPQVVTVRPREVPAYSRAVLVPNFYDRDFWPSITPATEVVRERQLSGAAPLDSMMAAAPVPQGPVALPPGITGPPLRSSTVGTPAPSAVPGATVTPREREIMELQAELQRRRQRIDSIRGRLDTLFLPGGAPPVNPDTLGVPGDTARRMPPTASRREAPAALTARTASLAAVRPVGRDDAPTTPTPRELAAKPAAQPAARFAGVPGTAPAKSTR